MFNIVSWFEVGFTSIYKRKQFLLGKNYTVFLGVREQVLVNW